eukprot:1059971-Prymnesium_polylepis.1
MAPSNSRKDGSGARASGRRTKRRSPTWWGAPEAGLGTHRATLCTTLLCTSEVCTRWELPPERFDEVRLGLGSRSPSDRAN